MIQGKCNRDKHQDHGISFTDCLILYNSSRPPLGSIAAFVLVLGAGVAVARRWKPRTTYFSCRVSRGEEQVRW